jgi:hypothetical protein
MELLNYRCGSGRLPFWMNPVTCRRVRIEYTRCNGRKRIRFHRQTCKGNCNPPRPLVYLNVRGAI